VTYAAEAYAFAYFGALIVIALVECVAPRRRPGDTLVLRWVGNFGVSILGGVLARVTFPLAGIGWAVFCDARGWGVLHTVTVPGWLAIVVTVLVIDLVNYTQHYVLHSVPVLWRLHRMHHTDHEFDFSTGVRFHPFEHLFSTVVSMAAIAFLGAPPFAVLVSQIVMVTAAFAEHANIRLPGRLDAWLRLVIVTPDMHRIHHSTDVGESTANFSNTFSFWDRLFGTYVAQPAAGHEGLQFGVTEFAERKHQWLHWMLVHPFLRSPRQRASVSLIESATCRNAPSNTAASASGTMVK
jgi:sterol desaturase/sphingolipid hydroxylase (fatty acid hydroxylase superfamily)